MAAGLGLVLPGPPASAVVRGQVTDVLAGQVHFFITDGGSSDVDPADG